MPHGNVLKHGTRPPGVPAGSHTAPEAGWGVAPTDHIQDGAHEKDRSCWWVRERSRKVRRSGAGHCARRRRSRSCRRIPVSGHDSVDRLVDQRRLFINSVMEESPRRIRPTAPTRMYKPRSIAVEQNSRDLRAVVNQPILGRRPAGTPLFRRGNVRVRSPPSTFVVGLLLIPTT